jgi:hypothetical protein
VFSCHCKTRSRPFASLRALAGNDDGGKSDKLDLPYESLSEIYSVFCYNVNIIIVQVLGR